MKTKDVLLIALVALALYVAWPFLEGLRADLAARPAGPELRMAAPVLVDAPAPTSAPPVIVTVVMEVTRMMPAPPATATATATAVQPTAVQLQPTATPPAPAGFDAACAAASAANRRAPARCSSNYATPTPAGEGR